MRVPLGELPEMGAATLSFPLAHQGCAVLIHGERDSRLIHCSENCATMDELIAPLTRNFCQREQCLPKTVTCDTAEKRRE
jgi:hypothetical protein